MHRHMLFGYMLGSRIPAQITAAGMAILSGQSDAQAQTWLEAQPLLPFTLFTVASKLELRKQLQIFKRQGWVLSEQQLELNYRGIAVPLIDRQNNVYGAISVTMPINNEDTEYAVKRVLPVMLEAARSLQPLL